MRSDWGIRDFVGAEAKRATDRALGTAYPARTDGGRPVAALAMAATAAATAPRRTPRSDARVPSARRARDGAARSPPAGPDYQDLSVPRQPRGHPYGGV